MLRSKKPSDPVKFRFSDDTPAAPEGYINVRFQKRWPFVSAYIPDAELIIPTRYNVIYSHAGLPPADTTYIIIVFERSVTFAANFSGSYGKCLTNPSATATYTVKRNGSTIGTVVISTGGTFTFATSGGTSQAFTAGQYLTIVTPTAQDDTLSDVSMNFLGAL